MLKPYVCVACEKVLITPDGVASLISLFSKIIASVPAEVEIPKNGVVPREWAVFSAWDIDPGDELKEHFICTQILYPDQTQFGEIHRVKMNVEKGKRSQVAAQMNGFPIGQEGFHTVRVWIEEKQQRVVGPIEFKIQLEIIRQPKTP
jgi:hypothetical protein